MTRISPAEFTNRPGLSILYFCIDHTLGFASLFEPTLTQASFFQSYKYQYHFWLEYLGPRKFTWSSTLNSDRLVTFFGRAKTNVPLNAWFGVSKTTYLLGRSSFFERSRVPRTLTGCPLAFPESTEYESGNSLKSSVRADATFVRRDPVSTAKKTKTSSNVPVFICRITRLLFFMYP